MKNGVLRNFANFTGKNLCQSLFFNKVADLRPATLLKKRLWRSCFPVNFAKFLRTLFFTERLCWLLRNRSNKSNISDSSQVIFTCSKSKIETLEKGIKYIQS